MSDWNPFDSDPKGKVECIDVDGLPVFVFSVPLEPELPAELSPSEREVVLLALAGASNQEIAAKRGTALQTVANQLSSVFRKLNINSRSELTAIVYGAGPAS